MSNGKGIKPQCLPHKVGAEAYARDNNISQDIFEKWWALSLEYGWNPQGAKFQTWRESLDDFAGFNAKLTGQSNRMIAPAKQETPTKPSSPEGKRMNAAVKDVAKIPGIPDGEVLGFLNYYGISVGTFMRCYALEIDNNWEYGAPANWKEFLHKFAIDDRARELLNFYSGDFYKCLDAIDSIERYASDIFVPANDYIMMFKESMGFLKRSVVEKFFQRYLIKPLAEQKMEGDLKC